MEPKTREALDELTARLLAADAIGQALEHAAGEQSPPAWVYVYRDQLGAVRQAAEGLEQALYRCARRDGGHSATAPASDAKRANRPEGYPRDHTKQEDHGHATTSTSAGTPPRTDAEGMHEHSNLPPRLEKPDPPATPATDGTPGGIRRIPERSCGPVDNANSSPAPSSTASE